MTPIKKGVEHFQHRKVNHGCLFNVLIKQWLHIGDWHGLHHVSENDIKTEIVDEIAINHFKWFTDVSLFNNIIGTHSKG